MYDFCCSNLLICYDPKYIEARSDSSKFDRKSDMYVSKWKKREFLVTDTHNKEATKHKNWKYSKEDNLNCKVKMNKPNNGLSSVTSKTQTYIPDTSVEKLLNCFNYEIDPRTDFHNISNAHKGSSTVVQKSSKFLKRSQIFPCFSSIIQNHKKCCRTNLKNLSVDGYREPFCARCEKRHVKSFSKERYKYAMRSPYCIDKDIKRPDPYVVTDKHRRPVYYNTKFKKNPFSKSSTSSYTSCDSEYENISRYCYKKRMQNYILKERERNKKMNRKYFSNKKQQCFSKIERLLPYQVIATPFWEDEKSYDSNSTRCSALPSTSSGFWEYLTDKITRKSKDSDRTKSCKCGQSASFISNINDPECLKLVEKISETEKKANAILAGPGENMEDVTKDFSRSKNCSCDCKKKPADGAMSKDVQTCSRLNTPCNKCNDDKNKKNESRAKGTDDSKATKPEEPCRAPHDEVLSKLKQKYNGEILCIHNPPCILINGCLNLPAANIPPKPTVACWPVNQVKKNNSYNFYKKIWSQKDKAGEQLDYYGVPYVSSSDCQMPVLAKKERYNHFNQKPICELVKLSCKPKYGVTAVNPRVHVAMLRKQPKCLIQSAENKQKSKYSQAANSPKKIILHRAKNKVTGLLHSKTEVLFPVDNAETKPGSVPVYHKNRLLRMIQVKRSATK